MRGGGDVRQTESLSPNVPVSRDDHPSCGPEERAYFGILTIKANDRQLAAGVSAATGQFGHEPYIAGYPLAERLAWK